jgi:hypothetical protein
MWSLSVAESDPSFANTILGLAVGGVAGFIAGKQQVSLPPDASGDALMLESLNQRISLMDARNNALVSLNASLQDQSTTGQQVQAALNVQIATLNQRINEVSVATFTGYPAVFGPGAPAAGGWIQGRDGLMISRTLPNFIANSNALIGMEANFALQTPIVSPFSVSDVTRKLPPRSITIGRSVNNCLVMSLSKGLFGSMAIVLNFAEDIADDPDFLVRVNISGGGYHASSLCVPIGRNSLLIMAISANNVPTASHGHNTWNGLIIRDCALTGVSSPTVAQRSSYNAVPQYNVRLSHRSARTLTLKSWNIVASPLASWSESNACAIASTDAEIADIRRSGPVTVVTRLNNGPTPKFYMPDEVGEYPTIDLSPTSYM